MNLAELTLDRAREAGDAIAVQMGRESLTYEEFVRESERVAAGLRELGIRRGDRVMMFSENSIEHLVTYLATARLGAIFTPIHASFQVSELEYVLANATPSAIIAQAALWDRLQRCGDQHLPHDPYRRRPSPRRPDSLPRDRAVVGTGRRRTGGRRDPRADLLYLRNDGPPPSRHALTRPRDLECQGVCAGLGLQSR